MLEVKNLSVAYGGLRALTDVSLSVAEGRFVTLVGPNGAGKSTLFKTISGVVPPVAGTITFGHENLLARRPSDRAHLGIDSRAGKGGVHGGPSDPRQVQSRWRVVTLVAYADQLSLASECRNDLGSCRQQ